jgi:MFS transporter, PPP family, 3-phenylpropionic acid transporter
MTGSPSALSRFLALYVALFAAFGVASPFLAAFLAERGLQPEAIGLVLAAGTAVRLLAGPLGGVLADRLGAPRWVLTGYATVAALVAFGYLPAFGLWPLLLVSVAHASVLAPIVPLADALAVAAGPSGRGFQYGWVRGAGSAAFILGTLLAGLAVSRFGLVAIIWLNGTLLAAAAGCTARVPDRLHHPVTTTPAGGFVDLLRSPEFRLLMLVAALIQGSHAMHDSFAVIRWAREGIDGGTIGLLWSESVVAEVVVFLFIGRTLLDRLTPAGASVLAAAAGILRWAVLAESGSIAAAALVEPLHGLTFALQHMACMRLLAQVVPPHLAATAQAFYNTVAVGAAVAVLTLASGPLYAGLGAGGFWVMSGLCAVAMPMAWRLRRSTP